jgi:hypothetical protein
MTTPSTSRHARAPSMSSTDAFEHQNFNAVDFINRVLPDERALAGVDKMIAKLRARVKLVDAEIMGALRAQHGSEARARDDFEVIVSGIDALAERATETERKAAATEANVREICADIVRLDRAKNHLTNSITTLRRLSMFVSGMEQLELFALRRQYGDAANLLQAASQLATHFEGYSQIPKIAELQEKYRGVKNQLRAAVFDDFHTTWLPHVMDGDAAAQKKLRDACLVVNALEPSVREELVGNLTNRELTNYASVFSAHESGDFLGRIARRYDWITRQLQSKESMWAVFPAHWRVPQLLSVSLCKLTRAQLAEALDARGPHDVQKLLHAMHVTIEFEMELDERFGTGAGVEDDELEGDSASASMLRQKLERAEREKQTENLRGGRVLPMDSAAEAAATFMFRGSVGSCFEDHLADYVALERRQLFEQINESIRNETWQGDETNPRILASATSVFLNIKKVFKRCSNLTRGKTLFAVHQVFVQVLIAYAKALNERIDVAALNATDARRPEAQRAAEIKCICLIVNTAEYCNETVGPLGDSMVKSLEDNFKEKVDMMDVEDAFSTTLSEALNKLIGVVEAKSNLVSGMRRVNWGALDVVGDQSEYVDTFERAIAHAMPVLRASVSDIHHTFFCEKLASSIAPKLYIAVFKCKRFSEIGGQQLLLDMHAVKAILLSLPAIAAAGTDVTAEPSAPPMSYAKMIAREMGKVEALVKTILSPNDGLAETFKALLPMTANATDFKAICLLKGMKPNEISEPPFGLFASVGAPASSKPLEDLPNVPNRPKAPRMDNVTAKMSGMFKQGTKQ